MADSAPVWTSLESPLRMLASPHVSLDANAAKLVRANAKTLSKMLKMRRKEAVHKVARMQPKKAAAVLSLLGEHTVAVLLARLNPRRAEAILSEMSASFSKGVRNAMRSTEVLSTAELQRRYLMYASLGVSGLLALSLGGCLAVYKRSRQITVGSLSIRPTGVYWRGSLLCCGASHVYKNLESQANETERSGNGSNSSQKVQLAMTSERRWHKTTTSAGIATYELILEWDAHEFLGDALKSTIPRLRQQLGVTRLNELEIEPADFEVKDRLGTDVEFDFDNLDIAPDLDSDRFPISCRLKVPSSNQSNKGRQWVLLALFALYVGVSTIVPISRASSASCQNGLYWEAHIPFGCIFFVTKVVELTIYATDETLEGELSFLDFFVKFLPSFLGYADGYTDAVSLVIAHSCESDIAQIISICMLATYVIGVVILQWGIVACVALQDPSHACLMKVLHMDGLASCVTLPEESRWTWIMVNGARTIGEDIPQTILQTLFCLYVKKNYFMMVSIAVSVGSSIKALYDASTRALSASGAEKKLQQDAFDQELVRFTASGLHEKLGELIQSKGSEFSLTSEYESSGTISPMMLAISASDRSAIAILQKAGVAVPDMTPSLPSLQAALGAGNLADAVRHIAAGADVNIKLRRGEGIGASNSGTPLHACCYLHNKPGAYEVLVLLLRCRADPSIGDSEGDTPLAHACYYNAESLYALLDANGAELAGPFYERRQPSGIGDSSDGE